MISLASIPMAISNEREDLIWTEDKAPDRTEAERLFLSFEPRYRRDECIVKVEYSFAGEQKEHLTFFVVRGLQNYLFRHRPAAAYIESLGSDLIDHKGQIYLMYADDCLQRFDITEAALQSVEKRDPRFEFFVSRQEIKPGPGTIDVSGAWIDDPDYDPEYWKLIKKAMRGDGHAFFQLAVEKEKEADALSAFLNYGMAAAFLPDGEKQDLAIKMRERTKKALTPDKLAFADKALEQNIGKIRSLLKSVSHERAVK